MNSRRAGLILWAVLGPVLVSAYGVHIDLVTVGNPGNPADTEVMNDQTSAYGSVAYVYQIGKFEITAGQYAEFLNAVARSDWHGLYSTQMASGFNAGCMISRAGSDGAYTYSVAPDWADRPVNFVSWASAARFCNWLANGQPSGAQGLDTTEDGSYYLNGATANQQILAVVRKPDAGWVLPSEDEWYKAAFHKNNGPTGDYWDYAMGSDSPPDNGNPGGDSGNSSNFYDGDFTIGAPYYRTPVGHFSNSASPYGTHDQGGNVTEWNESILLGTYRGLRGGEARDAGSSYQRASFRSGEYGYMPSSFAGFRVAHIPEPASTLLSVVGFALTSLRRRKLCASS